jgi:hypothetical protein
VWQIVMGSAFVSKLLKVGTNRTNEKIIGRIKLSLNIVLLKLLVS